MEREENRERLADARKQVEEGRDHAPPGFRRTRARAALSQAVNEGHRAGRQLDQLREQLRKKRPASSPRP